MHYLFGFSGRINRARMWLFILVTIAWNIVMGCVAVFGLSWTHYLAEIRAAHDTGIAVLAFPMPDPMSQSGWIALAVIGFLYVAYFVSMLAVVTKRLHDRNKGAIWLIPFVLIPWGVHAVGFSAAMSMLTFGWAMMPLGIGFGTARLVAAVLSIWAFIELFFFRGTAGPNQYGPDPLA